MATVAQAHARIDGIEAQLATILSLVERIAAPVPVPAQVQAAASTLALIQARPHKTSREIKRALFVAKGRALSEGESYTSVLRADASLRAEFAAVCDALGHPRTAKWAREGMPARS